jgi:hypothetical protein
MKTQLFYILLISLGTQLIYPNPVPRGSYQNTCRDIRYENGNLSASCHNGEPDVFASHHIFTTLHNVRPDQEVFNCRGLLTTDRC